VFAYFCTQTINKYPQIKTYIETTLTVAKHSKNFINIFRRDKYYNALKTIIISLWKKRKENHRISKAFRNMQQDEGNIQKEITVTDLVYSSCS